MPPFQVPSALETAPGRRVWEGHREQEYWVFVDESFYRFFDFSDRDGNFCHGAAGVPASEYTSFKAFFADTIAEYTQVAASVLGKQPVEIKHTDLYRLRFSFRRKFALRLKGALAKHGGFVAGFYTSNHGMIMERIRENLVPHAERVPEDHAALYTAAVQKLNSQQTGPGKADLISRLLYLPILTLTYFLNSFQCPFRIVYDPRQKQEDAVVKSNAEDYVHTLSRLGIRGLQTPCLGVDVSRTSDQEFGLQVADFVAGEVRRFFRYNAELLHHGTSLQLVTSESVEPLERFEEFRGRMVKAGRFVQTPKVLQRQCFRSGEKLLLPYLRTLIASGTLCCVTESGQNRMVRLFQGLLDDMCDTRTPL